MLANFPLVKVCKVQEVARLYVVEKLIVKRMRFLIKQHDRAAPREEVRDHELEAKHLSS